MNQTRLVESDAYGQLAGVVNQLTVAGWRIDRLGSRYERYLFRWIRIYQAFLSRRLPPSKAGPLSFHVTASGDSNMPFQIAYGLPALDRRAPALTGGDNRDVQGCRLVLQIDGDVRPELLVDYQFDADGKSLPPDLEAGVNVATDSAWVANEGAEVYVECQLFDDANPPNYGPPSSRTDVVSDNVPPGPAGELQALFTEIDEPAPPPVEPV
jgi:hypothetical protein